jgi:Tfp pilus assembly protein PilN
MNHIILQDARAAFFLLMGLMMLAMICAVAALGTVMRPVLSHLLEAGILLSFRLFPSLHAQ